METQGQLCTGLLPPSPPPWWKSRWYHLASLTLCVLLSRSPHEAGHQHPWFTDENVIELWGAWEKEVQAYVVLGLVVGFPLFLHPKDLLVMKAQGPVTEHCRLGLHP